MQVFHQAILYTANLPTECYYLNNKHINYSQFSNKLRIFKMKKQLCFGTAKEKLAINKYTNE